MAARSSFVVCGQAFGTKKALEQKIQAILHRGIITTVLSDEEQRFIFGVLAYHNNAGMKIGCGVAAITVRPAAQNSFCFWITRVDGTETDFSYKACLKTPSRRSEALKGFRQAVVGQVIAFRDSAFRHGPVKCAITGEQIAKSEAHIDHAAPDTFLCLVERFLNGRAIDTVDVLPTADGNTLTYLADKQLETEWQNYHQQHAKLRVAGKTAHLCLPRRSAA